MNKEEVLLEVQNLYTNFYTYAGVVKALDGISFSIRKGETFGLVGETGCGKSVTANTILQLIPMPPGKIESGHIFFSVPTEKLATIKELQIKVKGLEKEVEKDSSKQPILDSTIAELRKEYWDWDLLWSSQEYLQKIRGNQISMIFQEPMSALNPVFTAGDQIAEVMLQHEKVQLAKSVIKKIDDQIKEREEYQRVETHHVKGLKTGEVQCSKCDAVVPEEEVRCPQCGGFFSSMPLRHLSLIKLRLYRRFYRIMVQDPRDIRLRLANKVPILKGYNKLQKQEATDRAEDLLKLVKIPDPKNVLKSYPFELSGGMQQRVTIAMALACKPRLLIADEPTTALDVTIQAQILKLMNEIQRDTGTSILLITHNLGVVAETCNRVGVMYAGVMAEIGTVEDIFAEPLHPYTQGLMNSIPKVNADIDRLEVIEGNVPNLIKPPSGCRFNPRCPYAMDVCQKEKPPSIEIKKDHLVACHLYGEVKV